MWSIQTDLSELLLRATIVFFFLFIVIRIWGKKHFGEMTPFDLLLLLIMSEGIQNSLVGDEKSITGGLVTVGILVLLNTVMNKLIFHSKKAEMILEGSPTVLIENGILRQEALKKEKITDDELHESLREHGVLNIEDVRRATMENDGSISVVRRDDHPS